MLKYIICTLRIIGYYILISLLIIKSIIKIIFPSPKKQTLSHGTDVAMMQNLFQHLYMSVPCESVFSTTKKLFLLLT